MLHARFVLLASITLGVLFPAPSFGTANVPITIESQVNEMVVQPGDTIDWAIELSASPIDNAGLALISVDLVQNTLNPGKIVIPYADAYPTAKEDFARPEGINRPGIRVAY